MIVFQKEPHKKEEILSVLHELVKEWFTHKYKDFTPPQQYAILNIHNRENTLISSPTGSGKTLSAFLSIINELIIKDLKNELEDKVYAIYISPLKALANDIKRNLLEPLHEINELAKERYKRNLNIKVAIRTGDTKQSERTKQLKSPPHILITTPETLFIALTAKKFREKLLDVEWIIVDEIHALANKRGIHLALSLERLARFKEFTRIGLSATVAPLEEVAKFLVGYKLVNKNGKKEYVLRPCKIVDVQFMKKIKLEVIPVVEDFVNTNYASMENKLYDMLYNMIRTHKTTLIFTNTRAGTERIVYNLKKRYPKFFNENIGAHHGSLSRDVRLNLEERLKQGLLKCVVSSTSLELGIDIGYIDLVVLIGSAKSVARTLQRIGRAGHRLHETSIGKMVVMDRDDLVECLAISKSAKEKKIDFVEFPKNALDVLTQQIIGFVLDQPLSRKELYDLVRKAYVYNKLSWDDFNNIVDYLTGKFVELEDRNVYSKLYETSEGVIKAKALTRMIVITNVGTIPDTAIIKVKLGNRTIGSLDELFIERLQKHDTFVLGGQVYEFLHSRGNYIYVRASEKQPTVPSWVSEMLPLSFELAMTIQEFRYKMNELFERNASEEEIKNFISEFFRENHKSTINSVYLYFLAQYNFSKIPHKKLFLIESFNESKYKYFIFHSLYGRRVNDVLSRAFAYYLGSKEFMDFELGISDNGFYLRTDVDLDIEKHFPSMFYIDLYEIMSKALENTQLIYRRFRHCATRALMILRSYKGNYKSVAKQQLSSQAIYNLIKKKYPDFPILKETKREILEDYMDITHANYVLDQIQDNKIRVEHIELPTVSPFGFNIFVEGFSDLVKMEDRISFLRRMYHEIWKV